MITCATQSFTCLGRRDRDYISWCVTGVTETDSVDIALEGGPWWPMAVGSDAVVGYFAGPDFPAPGDAHTVPTTSHAEIRVSNALISVTFDGGFIQLMP